MSKYQAIALDMDGTLLTRDQKILPATRAALEQARAQGIRVLLVTGRHGHHARPFHRLLALDTPLICCNGAYLYDVQRDQILAGEPLAVDPLCDLLSRIEAQRIDTLLYLEQGIGYLGCEEKVAHLRRWSAQQPAQLGLAMLPMQDRADRLQQPIWKLELFHKEPALLRRFVDESVQGLPFTQDWTAANGVELVQAGCSKGNRLAQWAASEGIPMEHVVGFGDNNNDISMFQQVGLAVAMGNAAPEIQACADRITADHHEEGIALALQRWVLP